MKKDYQKLFRKGLAHDSAEADKQEMLSLFHRQEDEFELKHALLSALSDQDPGELSGTDLEKMFARLWAVIQQNKMRSAKGPRFIRSLIGIAAVLVIGLVAGILMHNSQNDAGQYFYEAHAPRGSISEVVLPDSTIIFLNADSRIRYTMNGKKGQREVFLEGEAWFDVTEKRRRPFLVHTPFYDVFVTGTKFNVKAYASDLDVTTTLEEGEVMIRSGKGCTIAGEIRVESGEQVVFTKDSKRLAIQKVNPRWFTSWKDNRLIFVNMSLRELVVLLERKYGVDIEVTNRKLLDLHFDGTIKNETIIEILEIIQKTLPVHYHISGQQIVITDK